MHIFSLWILILDHDHLGKEENINGFELALVEGYQKVLLETGILDSLMNRRKSPLQCPQHCDFINEWLRKVGEEQNYTQLDGEAIMPAQTGLACCKKV